MQTEEQRLNALRGAGYTESQVASAGASPNTPIAVSTLNNPQTPVDTTPPADSTDYQGTVNTAATAGTPPPTPPASDNFQSLFDQWLKSQEAPPSVADDYENATAGLDAGLGATVSANEKALNDAMAELNTINAELQGYASEAKAIPIRLQKEAEGRGITAGGLAPLERGQLRDLALRALPAEAAALAAQAKVAAAQGNVALAQKNYDRAKESLDKLFTLKSQDATNQYNYRTDMRNKIYEFASAQEQRKLDEQQKKDDEAKAQTEDRIKEMRDLRDTFLSNQDIDSAVKISKLDPNSPTYEADLAKIVGGMTFKPDGASSKTLSTTEIFNLQAMYPDAGIDYGDTPETIQSKIQATKPRNLTDEEIRTSLQEDISVAGNLNEILSAIDASNILNKDQAKKLATEMWNNKGTKAETPQIIYGKGNFAKVDINTRIAQLKKMGLQTNQIRAALKEDGYPSTGIDKIIDTVVGAISNFFNAITSPR